VSNHNFEATPPIESFVDMAHEAKAAGADYVKLSAMAGSLSDVRTLAEFTVQHADFGLIVIAMGPHGTSSRIFFPALGSRLTYAYASAYPVSGQLTFKETFDELRRFYPEFDERKAGELEVLRTT
jgi:3-dehydroquinate dehydratase-1